MQDGLDFLVLMTKADKLNRAEGQKALSIARLQTGGGTVSLFSSLKKTGVDDVSLQLLKWARSGLPQALQTELDAEIASDNEEDFEEEPPALDE